jgi:carbamoyltransferase
MPIIFGISQGEHSSGVAIVCDNEIEVVLEEERLNRVKSWKDFDKSFLRYPILSLKCIIERYGGDFTGFDAFTSFLPYEEIKKSFDQIGFNLPKEKFHQTDHHECHAYSSYVLSGFTDKVLIFCADASGGNNDKSSRTYLAKNGQFINVESLDLARKSLGHFYSALTELLGFKRLRDEGKVVGMSGHGGFWQELYDAWKDIIVIKGVNTDPDFHPIESGGIYSLMYDRFFKLVGSKYWKSQKVLNDIAATGQYIFEEKVIELLNNLHIKYQEYDKLCLSGGIFANVKLNKKISELEWVDDLFILPPMGDEGLALGSALITSASILGQKKLKEVKNMSFGNHYSEEEIEADAKEILGGYDRVKLDFRELAHLLSMKQIVGLFQGKSEHGARALGNRSIICDATSKEMYDILNKKLMRNDFMPFAPAVLDEDADLIFEIKKGRHSAKFMTILYNTRPYYQNKIPVVIHPIDKTARIQIVTEESNYNFYNILKAYKSQTGLGLLVNTSFNIHDEPIVERPREAFIHLKNGIVDYIATDNYLYKKRGT